MTVTIAVSVSIAVTHRPEFGATGSRENPGRQFMRLNLWGPRQNVERLGDLLNDGATDHRVTLGEAVQHRVIADVVNRARNSRRAAEDVVNRAGRKDFAISAGDFQTRLDVLAGFLDRRQRLDFATQRDALLELAQFRIIQDFAQFRLTGQHDLQLLGCV